MIEILKETLWKQFGATIDMLKNAIVLWPDERWDVNKKCFYLAYHTLFFLDYYLTIPHRDFKSKLQFTIAKTCTVGEGPVDDVIPDRIYTKDELLEYLQFCRAKCHHVIAELTEDKLGERWIEEGGKMNYAVLEILLYNMRHVQHHAAQLNLLLRQGIDTSPGWIGRATDDL